MGWLTTEELVFDAKGRLTTHAPSTYKIPVASDAPPDFRTRLHMRPNPIASIYRSKAVGEPPLMLAISVYSAILDAVHATAPDGQPQARSALHAGSDLERDKVDRRVRPLSRSGEARLSGACLSDQDPHPLYRGDLTPHLASAMRPAGRSADIRRSSEADGQASTLSGCKACI